MGKDVADHQSTSFLTATRPKPPVQMQSPWAHWPVLHGQFQVYCFTMAHFRLSICADDLQVPGGCEEAVHLLWGGLVEKGGQEHGQMDFQRVSSEAVYIAVAKAAASSEGFEKLIR